MSSRRELLIDNIKTALTLITTVSYSSTVKAVYTEVPENWPELEPGNCPALLVLDGDSTETPSSVWQASGYDMRANMTVLVACCLWDNEGSHKSARNNLIMDVKKVMFNSALISSLITSVDSVRVSMIGRGERSKYNHFNMEFSVSQDYAHSAGG